MATCVSMLSAVGAAALLFEVIVLEKTVGGTSCSCASARQTFGVFNVHK